MGSTHYYPFGTQQNHLLAALPKVDIERWQGRMELVDLSPGQILFAYGCDPEYVYFPIAGIVSLMKLTDDGASAEVTVVGDDGVVGISTLLGAEAAANEAVVQSAGRAFKISMHFVKGEIETSCGVMKVVLRYAQAVLAQMAQTVLCNRYHAVDQQFCRRLLLGLDRSPFNELDMTHEIAGNLLGVRRESITQAAHMLQEEGVIRYGRGHIVVLDRERLEKKACECYTVSKMEYKRLRLLPLAA